MEHSETYTDFAAAFVAAQAEIEGASKDKTNPAFRSSYADLASVSEACRPALNKNGIAVMQTTLPGEAGKLTLETTLLHKSGQWMKGVITIPVPKNDPQGFGSALTYARRYHLSAMVGVCPDDDDGNAASGVGSNGGGANGSRQPLSKGAPPPRQPSPAPRTAPPAMATPAPAVAPVRETVNNETGEVNTEEHDAAEPEMVTAEQSKEIAYLLSALPRKAAAGIATEFCKQKGVKRLSDLTKSSATEAIEKFKTLAAASNVTPKKKAS